MLRSVGLVRPLLSVSGQRPWVFSCALFAIEMVQPPDGEWMVKGLYLISSAADKAASGWFMYASPTFDEAMRNFSFFTL